MVVLSTETTSENASRLRGYARNGGTVLAVLGSSGPATALSTIAGVAPAIEVEDAAVGRDILLGEIAFDHPLFAPFAPAQFNDFTKIHFWKYRRFAANALTDSRILARFENGDPALLEKPLDQGRLLVMTSGWAPADSQLARSSKFVPFMATLLEGRNPRPIDSADHRVYERVALPSGNDAAGLVVQRPDGVVVPLELKSAFFDATDQPGVYTVGLSSFAVNLDPAESKTSPLNAETLEQFGCRLTTPARKAADRANLRQMQNMELEGRQKLWRWLILAAIGVLIVETWLADRLNGPRLAQAEALST